MNEYNSSNSDFFLKGKKLNEWLQSSVSQPMPENVRLTLDDGM